MGFFFNTSVFFPIGALNRSWNLSLLESTRWPHAPSVRTIFLFIIFQTTQYEHQLHRNLSRANSHFTICCREQNCLLKSFFLMLILGYFLKKTWKILIKHHYYKTLSTGIKVITLCVIFDLLMIDVSFLKPTFICSLFGLTSLFKPYHSWNPRPYILWSHNRHDMPQMGIQDVWRKRSMQDIWHLSLQVIQSGGACVMKLHIWYPTGCL